jgi:hypothetical protein
MSELRATLWLSRRYAVIENALADDGVPVHEQMLAGHANITTTQRYMNARVTSMAESIRLARERRATRLKDADANDER